MGRAEELLASLAPAGGLTPIEQALLIYLAEADGRTVSQDELLTQVWGYAPTVQTRAVTTTIRRIRKKIEDDPSSPEILRTVHGLGYQLVVPGSSWVSSAPVVTRESLEQRLEEWLGEGQGWVTVLNAPPDRNTNLTRTADRFVGRDADVAAIDALFAQGARLVTIHGAGGLGKTRLAREVAARRVGRLPGGVWFCDLSGARTAADAMAVVASELGLIHAPSAGTPLEAELGALVRARGPMCLVLDNFEQLDADAHVALARILGDVATLSFLVTSRALLGLPEERVHALEPLAPAHAATLLRERIEAGGGRPRGTPAPVGPPHDPPRGDLARGGGGGWRILRDPPLDPALLDEIAGYLEGVPLALEMAAARARILPLAELRGRLRSSFAFLALDRPGAPARQQSLERAIDWSWSLLSEVERRALVQLAAFRGGCTLSTAEQVVEVDGGALSVLHGLLDKSMVRAWDQRGTRRIGLFESVRQYALAQDEEGRVAARDRHAAWAIGLASEAEVETDRAARGRLHAELENLLEAHRWLLSRESPGALTVLEGLGHVYHTHGVPEDFLARARETRVRVALSADDAARLHLVIASALSHAPQHASATLAEVEAGLARVSATHPARAALLRIGSVVCVDQGRFVEAEALAREAVEAAEALGSPLSLGWSYMTLGNALRIAGDGGRSIAAYRPAIDLTLAAGAQRLATVAEVNLASALAAAGEFAEALALQDVASARAASLEDQGLSRALHHQRALTLARAGRLVEADRLFTELTADSRMVANRERAGSLWHNAAATALLLGDAARASRLFERALADYVDADPESPLLYGCRAWLLAAYATADEVAAAEALGTALAARTPRGATERAAVALALGHLDALRARHAEGSEAARHRAAAAARLEASCDDDPDLGPLADLLRSALHGSAR